MESVGALIWIGVPDAPFFTVSAVEPTLRTFGLATFVQPLLLRAYQLPKEFSAYILPCLSISSIIAEPPETVLPFNRIMRPPAPVAVLNFHIPAPFTREPPEPTFSSEPLAEMTALFRADPNLTKEGAQALAAILKTAYEQLRKF